jgi:ABC-type multidrug transport system permease subunit
MNVFRNAFVAAVLVLLPIAYAFTLRMQTDGRWDNIGTWYTVYCATAIVLPVALVFAAVAKLMLSQWRARR